MRSLYFFLKINFILLLVLNVSASIETNFSASDSSFLFKKNHEVKNNSSSFMVAPLYLDRDISIISSFSSLPGNIVTTLEQYCFNWEENNLFSLSSRHLKKSNAIDSESYFNEIGLTQNNSNKIQTFLKSKNYSSADDSIEAGARTEVKTDSWTISGEVAYEDFVASEIASPGLRAAVKGFYNFDYSISSQLKLAWQYFGDFNKSYIPNVTENAGGDIYSPKLANMNILNISLACMTSRKMFMSVDYYYYLQDKLKVSSTADTYSRIANSVTSGTSKHLGQELDIQAVYNNSENWTSRLFAGWFEPGNALNPGEDSKTFEIRGEIVVNF